MKSLLLVILTSIISIGFAQNYSDDFSEAFNSGDTLKQLEILNKWEKGNSQDAEYYTSYYNYYFNKSI